MTTRITTSLAAAALAFVTVLPVAAQTDPIWITEFAPGLSHTFYEFIADDAGNTYTVWTRNDDIAVTKFSPDGDFQWEYVFAGPVGQDIGAAISLNNDQSAVYALGRSQVPGFGNSDYTILKVDALAGTLIWSRLYDGGNLGIDNPQDIVGLPDGGVVATGGVDTPDEQRDYGTVKFDSGGNIVWERTFTGFGPFLFENDDARFIVATPEGDVVITGEAMQGVTRADAVTIKYDGVTGDTIWETRYSTPADDATRDLKLAPNGDVFVFGSDPFGIDRQWFLARFDGETGAQHWATVVDPGQDEAPSSIAVDAAGNVYATGATDPDGDDSNNNENAITIAYDGQTGAVLWLDEFGDEGIGDRDGGRGVYPDNMGNLYMFGTTRSEPLVGDPFGGDALVIRFDAATGERLDVTLIDTTEPGSPTVVETIFSITSDASGDVCAYGPLGNGRLFMKFDTGGSADCNSADLSEPLGVLDLADIQAFLAAFTSGDLAADLAPPTGVLDLADVQAFVAAFTTCGSVPRARSTDSRR